MSARQAAFAVLKNLFILYLAECYIHIWGVCGLENELISVTEIKSKAGIDDSFGRLQLRSCSLEI